MGHNPDPWYRASKDAWYVQIGGKQVRLAKGVESRDAAKLRYHQIMAAGGPPRASGSSLRVGDICHLYLAHAEKNLSPLTAIHYRRYLDSFAEFAGAYEASSVAPKHVTAWLAHHERPRRRGERRKPWGQSTKSGAIGAVKRAFRWAKIEGHLTANPFADISKPGILARELVMTPDQAEALRAAIPAGDPFLDLLDVLRATGCRPDEAYRIEAGHIDRLERVIVFVGKTTARTGKKRVIHLTGQILDRLLELSEAFPGGPILRSAPVSLPGGKQGARGPWTRHVVAHRFGRIRKRLGMGAEATAESYRHMFATDALEAGIPIATVAELMGHSSTKMLERHYSKLSQRRSHLREALSRIHPTAHQPSPLPHRSGGQRDEETRGDRMGGGGSADAGIASTRHDAE